jgi:hypothetical protein
MKKISRSQNNKGRRTDLKPGDRIYVEYMGDKMKGNIVDRIGKSNYYNVELDDNCNDIFQLHRDEIKKIGSRSKNT